MHTLEQHLRIIALATSLICLLHMRLKQTNQVISQKRWRVSPDPLSVSIVVPAFNAGRYIGETIESILNQDYKPLEVIVIDDGSIDDTAAIVQAFAPLVKLHRKTNAGQSAALNDGWRMSAGDLLGYVSADDKLRPNCVSRLVRALEEKPEAVLAYADFALIDEQSTVTRTIPTSDYCEKRLFAELHCFPGPGTLFRRSAFEIAGGWDTTFGHIADIDFFFRLALLGPFIRVPEVCAEYRVHSEAISNNPKTLERADEPLRMVEKLFAQPDLPARIRGWKPLSVANANLVSGLMHGRSGRYRMAMHRFSNAVKASPPSVFSRKAAIFAFRVFQHSIESRFSRR